MRKKDLEQVRYLFRAASEHVVDMKLRDLGGLPMDEDFYKKIKSAIKYFNKKYYLF